MDIGRIAELAGVSRSTVSYALSGKRPISQSTRERIEKVMHEAGFVPNAAAQALKRGSTQTLGFVMPPADHRHLTSGQLEMLGAAVEAAADLGYDVLLSPGGEARDDSFGRLIAQRRVDGILLTETRVRDPRVARARHAGLPYVLIGRTSERPNCDWVDVDHGTMIRMCLRHLVQQGRSRIALANRGEQLVAAGYGPVVRSHKALFDEADRLGIQVVDIACEDNFNAAHIFVAELLSVMPDVDGIITINEAALPGLMPALVRGWKASAGCCLGLRYRVERSRRARQPPLTSCDNPVALLAEKAVQALVSRIQGNEDRTQLLLCSPLLVRESSLTDEVVSA